MWVIDCEESRDFPIGGEETMPRAVETGRIALHHDDLRNRDHKMARNDVGL